MEVIIILTLTSVSGSGALATSVIKTFHFINVISVNYWLHNSVKLVNKTIIMFSGISDTIATCTGSISKITVSRVHSDKDLRTVSLKFVTETYEVKFLRCMKNLPKLKTMDSQVDSKHAELRLMYNRHSLNIDNWHSVIIRQ